MAVLPVPAVMLAAPGYPRRRRAIHTRLRSGAVLCVVLGRIMARCATTIETMPPTVIRRNVTAVRFQDNPILTPQSSP
jgi:hypothetical protein